MSKKGIIKRRIATDAEVRRLRREIAKLQSKKDIEDIEKQRRKEIAGLKTQKRKLKYRKVIGTGKALKEYGKEIKKAYKTKPKYPKVFKGKVRVGLRKPKKKRRKRKKSEGDFYSDVGSPVNYFDWV